MPVLGAGPVALLFPKLRALTPCIWSAEGKLIFTPSSIVGSTDKISGSSDLESNHPWSGDSLGSISYIVLLRLSLTEIKLNIFVLNY